MGAARALPVYCDACGDPYNFFPFDLESGFAFLGVCLKCDRERFQLAEDAVTQARERRLRKRKQVN